MATSLQAGGAVSSDGQLSGTGKLQLQAGGDATLKGSLRSNGDLTADAGGKLALLGSASATTGALNLTSVGDLSIGKDATAQAGGAIGLRTQGNVTTAGAMASLQALTISAAGDAAIDGKLLAGGPLSIDAIGKIAAGADAKLQAGRAAPGRRQDADAGRPGRDQRRHDAGLGHGPARGRQRHGLWRRAVVDGGPGADAGRE